MSSRTSSAELVDADRLATFAYEALTACEMPPDHARAVAAALVWADLRGLDAHGVCGKLGQCVARIRAGGTRADATLPVVQERHATAVLDGEHAWGQVAGIEGMRVAIERARRFGFGVASVRDVSSAAALGYYPTLAIEERMIGIAITNCPPIIPAWGGTAKLLGNQAHAIGCPADRHFPILFDSATTKMSTGEMDLRAERGELLPEDVLLDATGRPTRDPALWTEGLLVPIGGYRGFALSLLLEVLTGVLAGGSRQAPEVGHPFDYATPQGVSMILLAIDPEISQPYDDFVRRVDELVDRVHAAERAPGVDEIYLPGEQGYRTARRRARDGVPMTGEGATRLTALAAELGIATW